MPSRHSSDEENQSPHETEISLNELRELHQSFKRILLILQNLSDLPTESKKEYQLATIEYVIQKILRFQILLKKFESVWEKNNLRIIKNELNNNTEDEDRQSASSKEPADIHQEAIAKKMYLYNRESFHLALKNALDSISTIEGIAKPDQLEEATNILEANRSTFLDTVDLIMRYAVLRS